jgi:hypothetical protein
MSADDSRLMRAMSRRLVPETAKVLAQHLTAGPPADPRTVSPTQVRERLVAPA